MELDHSKRKFQELKNIIETRQAFEEKLPPKNRHQQTTTFDLADADELTLLYYAIHNNDKEAIEDLITKGVDLNRPTGPRDGRARTAIETALNLGNLELAELFLKHGIDIKTINIASITHQAGRQFYQKKLSEVVNERIDSAQADDFSITDINMVIATSDVSLFNRLKKKMGQAKYESVIQGENLSSTDIITSFLGQTSNNPDLMRTAIYAGNLDIVKQLIADNYINDLNSPNYTESYLMLAARLKRWDMVGYFSTNNANLKHVSTYKWNILPLVIGQGDINKLKFFLDLEEVDPTQLDIYQNNILHYAIMYNQLDIYAMLVQKPEIKPLLEQKNIYGETPLQMAKRLKRNIESSHDISIAPMTDISMLAVMPSLKHYLLINNRDLSYFAERGYCNGLTFLFGLYSANGMQNYFFNTLSLISSWDRNPEMLTKPFKDQPGMEAWAKKYENLGDLIEHWIQDLNWFVGKDVGDRLSEQLEITQRDRIKQYNMVKHHAFIEDDLSTIGLNRQNMTIQGLHELFNIFKKMPSGLYVDVSSKVHNVAVLINDENKFQYYDPNNEFVTTPVASAEEICGEIVDTNYIALMSSLGINHFDDQALSFDVNWMNLKREQTLFNYYDPSEYPKKENDVEKQTTIHNKFSPLHIAVFTRSLQNISDLLTNKFIDINAKDIFNKTALDYALDNRDVKIIELFMKHNPQAISDQKIFSLARSDPVNLPVILKFRDEASYSKLLDDFPFKENDQKQIEIFRILINDPTFEKYQISFSGITRIISNQQIDLKNLNLATHVSAQTIKLILSTLLMDPDLKALERFFSLKMPVEPLDQAFLDFLKQNNLSVEIQQLLEQKGLDSRFNSAELHALEDIKKLIFDDSYWCKIDTKSDKVPEIILALQNVFTINPSPKLSDLQAVIPKPMNYLKSGIFQNSNPSITVNDFCKIIREAKSLQSINDGLKTLDSMTLRK